MVTWQLKAWVFVIMAYDHQCVIPSYLHVYISLTHITELSKEVVTVTVTLTVTATATVTLTVMVNIGVLHTRSLRHVNLF